MKIFVQETLSFFSRLDVKMPPSGTGIGAEKQRVVRNVLTDYHGLLVNNLLSIHKVNRTQFLEIQTMD